MHSHPRPLFANPPIVELVLGLQFAPLVNLTSAHAGRFWLEALGPDWPQVTEASPLPDQFETFEPRRWTPAQIQVKFGSPMQSRRLMIWNRSGDRLIQIQQTQFLYNWQKKEEGVYPSFDRMFAEFTAYFDRFKDFAEAAQVGTVALNQWELTYVDQVPAGDLWQSPADWHRVLPGLISSRVGIAGLKADAIGGDWHYEIPPARGRLHLAVQPGVTAGGAQALFLQTTVRGPIGKDSGADINTGFNLGHEVACNAFLTITSEEAQAVWGRRA